jgi:hypothetical protein
MKKTNSEIACGNSNCESLKTNSLRMALPFLSQDVKRFSFNAKRLLKRQDQEERKLRSQFHQHFCANCKFIGIHYLALNRGFKLKSFEGLHCE